MNDLVYLPLSELQHVIKNKELSPVELLESVISHITKKDPDVNAYITYTFESAIEKANEAERDIMKGLYKGPLHGVPIGLKDIIHFKGTYTTSGSQLFANRLSKEDADVVNRLNDSGAIIIGKENMHSLAYGSTGDVSHFGPIKNPFNFEKIAGGSSSGSAAGVSSYFSYGSIGSDTGGSIRIPAALCGVVGMKPTFGLISRVGVESLVPTLDTLGPITRTVEDNALLLDAIARSDSIDFASFTGKEHSLKVIGVPKRFFFDIIEPEIKSHFEKLVRNLVAAGYKIKQIEIPHMEAFNKANSIIFAAEVYESLKKEMDSQSDFIEEEIRLRILEGQRIKASEYTSMCKVKKQAIETFTTILKQVDVIMTPTVPAFPSDLNQRQIEIDEETYHIRSVYSRLVKASNLTGFPAMAVPSGKSREGYAHSVQLIGLPFQEKKLYNLASVIEQLS
ncbi:amidase [Alkalibacterium iburiense]|uniref:Amidase n=1 Tax=Alkalibacterium iburiense TaxID=290589 RepID=A0ABN0XJB1_9LACT